MCDLSLTTALTLEGERNMHRQAESARALRRTKAAREPQASAADRTPFVLLGGSRMVVRPLRGDDRPAVRALLERLSPLSLAQRFHSAGVRITDAVVDTVTAGHVLVAEVEGLVVGLASYFPDACTGQAEAAIVVDDAYQGRGIGRALCMRLYRDAQQAGIRQIRAEVQAFNLVMINLLRHLRLPMKTTRGHGVIQVEIAVEPNPADAPRTPEMEDGTALKSA